MDKKDMRSLIFMLIIGLMVGFTLGREYPRIRRKVEAKLNRLRTSVIAETSNGKIKEESKAIAEGIKMISNFERADDLNIWEKGKVCRGITTEYATEGKHSLKVTFPAGEYPGLSTRSILTRDWSGYDTLRFNVYNPYDEVIKFGILVKDELSDAYPDRYDSYFALKPGMNKFSLNITGLKTNNKKRMLAMDKIKQLVIFLIKPAKETILYFDNIRLEKEKDVGLKNLYRFDFGAGDSPVWSGFTKVTNKSAYSSDKGYGWSNVRGLTAKDRHYPDPLLRDWVRGAGPFNVDLPNGEYGIYMMLEDPGYWEYYQNYEKREIYAEEKLVLREYLNSSDFFTNYYFKHLNSEDLPGEDIWEKYIKVRFVPKIFTARVEDGQLNLSFSPSWGYACTMSALIVYPLEKEDEAKEYIKELNRKRKEYFNNQYVESVPKLPSFSFAASNEDIKRGYILFTKNYLEKMYPNTKPREKEVIKEITIFAVRGEYEPFTICIYPLKDLGMSEVTLEKLVNEDGIVISSENIDIRVVQYKLTSVGSKVYEVRGELLRKKNKVVIRKGITRQFWVTVKIPDNIPAGNYKSKLKFKSQQGKPQTVFLNLKVLPFRLSKPDIAMGMFYFTPAHFRWYEETQNLFWSRIEEHLRDLREHNINSLAISICPRIKKVNNEGAVELDLRDLGKFIAIYKGCGFKKPIIGYGMLNLIRQAERISEGDERKLSTILQNTYITIKERMNNKYGSEIVFCLADEISNVGGRGINYGIELAKIAHQVPRIKTTAFLNSPKDEVIFPYLDISAVNNGMKINKRLIDKINKSDSKLWLYNIGQDRFTFGFYLWKTQAKGRLQWNYQLPAVDPYNDLDGRESDYCASYPSMDGPINSVWFEYIREGIDDYRYILTLSELIKKGKVSENIEVRQQAEEAERTLEHILEDAKVDLTTNKPWNSAKYDSKRWEIAKEILKLTQLLKE